jgi:hypothetical protein
MTARVTMADQLAPTGIPAILPNDTVWRMRTSSDELEATHLPSCAGSSLAV